MKESSDSVHFQTQVQAQSCCFSQLTTVLFDVSSSVLSEQAPLPTTALHQVLTAQLSQQLLRPPPPAAPSGLLTAILPFKVPESGTTVQRWFCSSASHQPMPYSAASPCSHRELPGAPAQGWCLTSHLLLN